MTETLPARPILQPATMRQKIDAKSGNSEQGQNFSLFPDSRKLEEGLDGGLFGQYLRSGFDLTQSDHAIGFDKLGVLGLQSPVSYRALSQSVEGQNGTELSIESSIAENPQSELTLAPVKTPEKVTHFPTKTPPKIHGNQTVKTASFPAPLIVDGAQQSLSQQSLSSEPLPIEDVLSSEATEAEMFDYLTDGADLQDVKRIEAITQSLKSAHSSPVQLAVYAVEYGLRVYARLANLTADDADKIKQTIDNVLKEYGIFSAQTDVETFSLGENFKAQSSIQGRT